MVKNLHSSLFLLNWSMIYLLISLLWLQQADTLTTQNKTAGKQVAVISVEGTINPTAADYILRGIETARQKNVQALVVKLDTPGGMLKSMKKIVQAFLRDDGLPVVVYVTPEGASAASAGTFITMAANIAAMAPATNIGAASPVTMGGGEIDTVMQKKLFNYSSSFIRSIAKQRGRNIKWAVSAVRSAESVTAEEAVELNIVDFIASDMEDLLAQIDGKTIEGRTLQTKNGSVLNIEPSFAEEFLGFIMQPLVVMILTLVAIWGIMGEISNPGAVIPGIAGAIALILVLYASAALPLNTAGYILIVLAVALFVAEAFTPTFGILITGGAIAMFIGFLMLFNDLPKSMQISWEWLAGAAVLTALFFAFIGVAGLKAQFKKRPMGSEGMVGMKAIVVDSINDKSGRVLVRGEYWTAVSDEPLDVDETVIIEETEGLTVKVKKA